MQKRSCFKLLSLYLVLSIFFLTLPSQGWAMFIASGQAGSVKQADMNTIQKTLESTVVKQRLKDFGLSSEEAMARVNSLSDEQVHEFAANLDSVQAGADGVGTVVFILLVLIIVVVILQASGHKVIVTK
jgi:hypothetical protein